VHAEITRRALSQSFSAPALKLIIAANIRVDALWNQVRRDELHFDNNSFLQSRAYIVQQRALIAPALKLGIVIDAWRAFGRLTHTAQDFYAHSNYVDLWLACQAGGMVPAPAEIDPVDDALVESPALRSGRSYLPFGALSFVPGLGRLILPLLPRDSHARMNLDSSARGPLFDYAFQAAVKRTRYEYQAVAFQLTEAELARFRGMADSGFSSKAAD
jgi:hypothetical protein